MPREVGIVINAKDSASKAYKSLSKEAEKAESKVESFATTSESSLFTVEAAVNLVNTAFTAVSGAVTSLNDSIDEAIDSALAMRKSGNELNRFFDKARVNSEMLSVRIGEILTPVIVGLGKAIEWNDDALNRYLETNRELISLGITDTLEKIALALIEGVGWALNQVGAAWRFLQISAMETRAVFANVLQDMSDGLLIAANKVIAFGTVLGSETMVNAGKGIRDAINETVESMKNAEQEANAMREALEAEQEASERNLSLRIQRIQAVVSEGAETTREVIRRTKASENLLTEHQLEQIEIRRQAGLKAIEDFVAGEEAKRRLAEKQNEFTLQLSQHAAEQYEKQQQRIAMMTTQIANQFSGAMSEAISATIASTKSAGRAFKEFRDDAVDIFIDLAVKQITAAAAKAAAEAFAGSMIFGPIMGPIVGAAAAAAVYGGIMAFKGKMKMFGEGGIVTGGTPGQDSVPALLTPGERVLSVDEARTYQRSAAPVSINTTVVATELPQRQQRRRLTNQLAASIEEAILDGRIRLQGA